MSSYNNALDLTPSPECHSSESIQTLMIINDNTNDQSDQIKDFKAKIAHNINAIQAELSLEISQSGTDEDMPLTYASLEGQEEPVRHVSALSFISKFNSGNSVVKHKF